MNRMRIANLMRFAIKNDFLQVGNNNIYKLCISEFYISEHKINYVDESVILLTAIWLQILWDIHLWNSSLNINIYLDIDWTLLSGEHLELKYV